MINPQTRIEIKGYLEGFIEGLVEQHRPARREKLIKESLDSDQSDEGGFKPFHEAIIPPQILRISSFERSFSTKLGTTFEECARLIAKQNFRIAKRGYVATGQMPASAASKIEELVSKINQGHHVDFPAMVEIVLAIEDENWVERPVVADLYLEDKEGKRYFFEVKSPKPNKGQCLEITERLLRIHAIAQYNRPIINAYFAMAYNPYGTTRESYSHSFSMRYLDMKNQVLLGSEFWTLLGGHGTYEELLDIYQEVGREKGKDMLDALVFGF